MGVVYGLRVKHLLAVKGKDNEARRFCGSTMSGIPNDGHGERRVCSTGYRVLLFHLVSDGLILSV